jgi:hypothetical protein
MTVYDFDKQQKQVPSQGTKVTASRLAEVDDIQKLMRNVSNRLSALAAEESHGWVPGTPQTKRTHRVEPIETLAEKLADGVYLLERLYS